MQPFEIVGDNTSDVILNFRPADDGKTLTNILELSKNHKNQNIKFSCRVKRRRLFIVPDQLLMRCRSTWQINFV